jgi:hypothetical protein
MLAEGDAHQHPIEAATQEQIERLIDAIAQGIGNGAVVPRIAALETHQKRLEADLASLQEMAQVSGPAVDDRSQLDPARREGFAAELNSRLRMVLKGLVFDKDGGIREWNFQ